MPFVAVPQGFTEISAANREQIENAKFSIFQCVLNKISCISLFLSHLSADDFKIYKALESKILHLLIRLFMKVYYYHL